MIIAIDGIVSSGKSSISKGLAARLGFRYCGAGSIYRTIALKLDKLNVSPKDIDSIKEVLKRTVIKLAFEDGKSRLFLDGDDVTEHINTPEISKITPVYAVIPEVRAFVKSMQHKIGDEGNVIMEGRDIGTVVFPNADLKLFLIASDEVRTHRRMNDFEKQGRLFSYEDALKDILERDKADIERETSPLKRASDALVFDNSDYTLEQALDILEKMIRERFRII